MTLTRTPLRPLETTSYQRDTTIDAIRAACLLVVVVLHSLMVGVELSPKGGILTSVALEGQTWFTPITWLLQIMPLFFIAGGYASLSQWRRMRASGASAAEYVAGRVKRLAVPAAIMITIVGAVLLAAKAFGADAALIDEASLRIGQPLWFLVVYFGVTALVPAMAWLHEKYPARTIAFLGLGVLAVDLAQGQFGLPFGYLNLALVWPLMQQLGFAMLDGACADWSRRKLLAGMTAALTLIFVLIACGWSPDMLVNLNPPTVAIVLLGTAQFFALQLLRRRLVNAALSPTVTQIIGKASSISMGVYLWHMPVILILVSILWATGMPLPAPHSGAWWLTRVPWLLLIAVCVIPFVELIARFETRVAAVVNAVETRHRAGVSAGKVWVILSVMFSIAGTAIALLIGIATPASYLLAVAMIIGSIALAVISPRPRISQSRCPESHPQHRLVEWA